MALSTEEVIALAVERMKSRIDEVVESKLKPFFAELDSRLEAARQAGQALMAERAREGQKKRRVVEEQQAEVKK